MEASNEDAPKWQYLDKSGTVQGLYTAALLLAWNAAHRFFDDDVKVGITILGLLAWLSRTVITCGCRRLCKLPA
jgi:GYF domain